MSRLSSTWGNPHYGAGRPDEARACFERAIEQEPGNAKARFNLALTCEQLGLVEGAQRHRRRYLDLDPTGAWAAIAREHLGGSTR
jgi:tetratricopeptide (TPR) repeat protein